jgi:hypothetical protein
LKGARTTEHATETGKIKFKLRICVILFCTVSDIDPHVSCVCLELKWAVLGDCMQLISMSTNNKETKVQGIVNNNGLADEQKIVLLSFNSDDIDNYQCQQHRHNQCSHHRRFKF